VVDRGFDGSSPDEAEIASARLYRKPRNYVGVNAGPMYVQLLLAEAVHRNTVRIADELCAEDVAVEGVRARPLGDVDRAMIEPDHHRATLLHATTLRWETDPSLRDNELAAAFADVWCAISKVVFSRTLDSVQGNARFAKASVAEAAAAAVDATDKDVAIGGAGLAAAAIERGLVDELRLFRNPVVVGGGTPFLPPVTEDVLLELIETRTFGSRVICERYGPTIKRFIEVVAHLVDLAHICWLRVAPERGSRDSPWRRPH
jgi:hypothetical protein